MPGNRESLDLVRQLSSGQLRRDPNAPLIWPERKPASAPQLQPVASSTRLNAVIWQKWKSARAEKKRMTVGQINRQRALIQACKRMGLTPV